MSLAPDPRTIANVRRDFVEWHLGRAGYALWALEVDVPAVVQRLAQAQAHLAARLLDGYRRQPHITLGLCGFLGDRARHRDDFDGAALQTQIEALQCMRPRAFDIEVGALATFSSAPYLAVHEPHGHLARLRDCVAQGPMNHAPANYVPHVTVGLFRGAWPLAEVQVDLQAFNAQGLAPLSLCISHLALLSYQAADIGGPLTRLARYELASGTLFWDARPAVLQSPCLP